MKKLLYISITLVLLNCSTNNKEQLNSIIGMEFQNLKEINQLSSFTKKSDTTIYENNIYPKHGILHLQNVDNDLIVFKRITHDSIDNRTYKVIDTLIVPKSNSHEYITIGYCQFNDDMNENIIALVERSDSLFNQNIIKAWWANTTSEKIEVLEEIIGINCLNEWYRY